MWAVHVGLIEQPVQRAHSLAVEQIIYHARYRPKGLDYDIALMKLAKSLVFNGSGVLFQDLAEYYLSFSTCSVFIHSVQLSRPLLLHLSSFSFYCIKLTKRSTLVPRLAENKVPFSKTHNLTLFP